MSNELSLWHLYTRQNETDAILSSHGHDVANITGLSEVAISGDFTDLNNIPSLVNSIQGRNGNVTLSAADVDAIPSSASCNKLWNWVLKTEQPSYVWGGNEKSTMYIYNPATFNVAYATSSDTANNSKLLKNRDLCAEVDVIKSDIDNLPTSLPANGGNADTVDGKHASDFILLSTKGSASGIAELDSNGKVPSSQLPSYVDDVIEGTLSTFPTTGETGKIYVDTTTNKTYRWGGTSYVIISDTISLGETSSTAYRGDRGKVAYDHSQTTHAPSNAQKNSDITKAEIEAKLTGNITTHTHDYDNYQKWVVKVNSEATGKDMTKGEILNIKGSGSTTVTRTGSDITISSTDNAYSNATTTTDGLMASSDKSKLNGIEANANNYIHPTTDGNKHVPATGTTNNGKVLTAGSTAGSLSWTALPTALPANGGNADTLNGLSASNAANNIPVLDNNAKLSIAQIPTGTTSTTVSLGDHTHEYLPTSGGTISGNLAVTGTTDFTGNVGFNGHLFFRYEDTDTDLEVILKDICTPTRFYFTAETGVTIVEDTSYVLGGAGGVTMFSLTIDMSSLVANTTYAIATAPEKFTPSWVGPCTCIDDQWNSLSATILEETGVVKIKTGSTIGSTRLVIRGVYEI